MADGQLEVIWSKLLYAKRALSSVRPALSVIIFLLLHCTGVFLCIWRVLTRLARDWTRGKIIHIYITSNNKNEKH